MSAVASSSSAGKTNRLFIGNLAPNVDEYTLVQVFSKYGKITKLDIMYHKTGPLKGKPRGYAFVEYSSTDDALKALVKLHDRLLRGRKLVVTYANAAPPDEYGAGAVPRGRRSDAPERTTLSLLKAKNKPKSAQAQIAAMEAKLASLAKRANRTPTPEPEPVGADTAEADALALEAEIMKEIAQAGQAKDEDENKREGEDEDKAERRSRPENITDSRSASPPAKRQRVDAEGGRDEEERLPEDKAVLSA